MAKRRYITEMGFHSVTSATIMLQQGELESIASSSEVQDERFHIYLITQRPRITFDPESLVLEAHSLSGRFRIQQQETLDEAGFSVPLDFDATGLQAECRYPYSELRLRADQDSEPEFMTKASILATMIATLTHRYNEVLDLEVLYIGQSYGVSGSRTAPARLASHSTLQAIYADLMSSAPDKEVWIILLSFQDPFLLFHIDPRHGSQTTDEEDNAHMMRIIREIVSEQQEINLIEASLIKYFQPPFNSIFRGRFPNPAHKTYSECYELDFNSVSIDIDTETIGVRLYSQVIEPKWLHIPVYSLHSEEERQSMWSFVD